MDAISNAKLPFNLRIVPVSTSGLPVDNPIIVMFNPESIAIDEEIDWDAQCPPGNEGSDYLYNKTKPRKFRIEFTLDGTGVNTNGTKIPIASQIASFRAATTGIRGDLHRPNFLLVQYGTFVSTCILNSSTVTYTMFDMHGLVIRAKINASFTERTVKVLSDILGMLSSPDLTHKVEVKHGDTLPLLTYNIYNNQTYYLQVAKVNKLKNFRNLKAGTTIVFPPISDK